MGSFKATSILYINQCTVQRPRLSSLVFLNHHHLLIYTRDSTPKCDLVLSLSLKVLVPVWSCDWYNQVLSVDKYMSALSGSNGLKDYGP